MMTIANRTGIKQIKSNRTDATDALALQHLQLEVRPQPPAVAQGPAQICGDMFYCDSSLLTINYSTTFLRIERP